jgi:sulfatase maturation enzyme AslB (radical SAM superfamily)
MSSEKCKYPFQSISIYPSGHIRPCCAYSENVEHISKVDNIVNFFYYNEHLNQLRQNEISGVPTLPGCNLCYNKASTNSSRKSIFNSTFKLADDSKEDKLTFLDISFGNTCNLTCVMCSSEYSSKLRKIETDFNRDWKPVHETFSLSKEKVDAIVNQLDDLLMIDIKGGEPFASKECLHFLEQVTLANPNIEIQVTTNLTLVNDSVIDILKSNPKIKLIVSLDGIGKTYEWIRGIEFSVVEEKLRLVAESSPKSLKRINFCTSAFNVNHIVEFDHWLADFKKKYPSVTMFVIYDLIAKEDHVSPLMTVTPEIIVSLQNLKHLQTNTHTKNSLDRLIEYCSQSGLSLDRTKFLEWHSFILSQRGFDILEH